MNRRTVDTRLSSAPTHLIKREPGNEAKIKEYNGIGNAEATLQPRRALMIERGQNV